MNEKVRLSKSIQFTTSLITLFMFALVAVLPYLVPGKAGWGSVALLVIVCAIFFTALFLRPVSIHTDHSELTLKRGIGKVSIPFSNIRDIGAYLHENVSVRVFGIGGFFGRIGIFHTKSLGNYISYMGDINKAFYVKTKTGKTYLFSCENRDAVIEEVRANLTK